MSGVFDLAIIGGGINGCGIARDAAGRGLSVLLLEQGDLAAATSSASTKLIHGGLRYLEYGKFRLVRESLGEREILLQTAPHIVWPLRFVLPHHKGLRPWWMIRIGLFLYDCLGGRPLGRPLGRRWGAQRILPRTRVIDLRDDPVGLPLRADFTRGFEYSDCGVDDARLVVLTARDAARLGAEIRPRTRCEAAHAVDGVWALSLSSGAHERARVVVNAAGPWVSSVLSSLLRQTAPTRVRLVKGSHIVVPRQFEHDRCYLFQNADGRICFAIPYERDFTLIGTTDDEFAGDPASATVSPEDEAYLCAAVSAYLRKPVPVAAVVWRYAGVRPLRDDGASKAQEATRDYVLELTGTPPVLPPVLSVFGGKITTHRRLAEAALARLAGVFPGMRRAWTAGSPLPGGDFPWNGSVALRDDLLRRFPFVHTTMAERLVRAYGTLAGEMLGNAKAWADLGHYFGATLTQREVDWLVRHEWARTTDDILWRRSKLGLRLTADDIATLQRYLADST